MTVQHLRFKIKTMATRHHAHVKLSRFSRGLLAEWRKLKLPIKDSTIIVAVSGGTDSTALLLGVEELIRARKLNLTVWVGHLDHALRAESRKDAKWVSQLAKDLGFEIVVSRAKVAERAQAKAENLEQAAREARYEFLERAAKKRKVKFVLTAHTMDDQAETVLLRLMRGSSGSGLGGMEAVRPIAKGSPVKLVRPLLWTVRKETEDYCRQRGIAVLHDEMNDDERFSRVKVRKQLIPMMQSFNNRIVEALSRTANMLREDGAVLLTDSAVLLKKAADVAADALETDMPSLSVSVLAEAPSAIRRRALREWITNGRGDARRLEMAHLLAVERLLEGTKGGRTVELPSGAKVRRNRGLLEFVAKND